MGFGSSKLSVLKLGGTGHCYATAAHVSSPISAQTLMALVTKKVIDNSPCRAVTTRQGICFCRERVTAGLTETQR